MSEERHENEDTLLARARANYCAAVTLRNDAQWDELYLNIIAYHLQQAVELAIKYRLETEGFRYPPVHDIDQLIRIGNENGIDTYTEGYIDEHAEMLSQWEAKTRYIRGYKVEERKIAAALSEIDKFLTRMETR